LLRYFGKIKFDGALREEFSMALTKSFKELVQNRLIKDKSFADAVLCEGVDTLVAGNVQTSEVTLRYYIKATVGFEQL
jgi:hypothetical protein